MFERVSRFFHSFKSSTNKPGAEGSNTAATTTREASGLQSTPAKTMSKKAIHFGGGNIGRGFVAEFLHKSGYEVVFVDVMDDLIKAIQESKSYDVTEVGTRGVTHFTITNYRAINSKTDRPKVVEEIATADLVTCAVGPKILPRIAAAIAEGIDSRKKDTPLAVIACENAIGATDTLAGHIKETLKTAEADLPNKVRYANSAIDRIVPQQEPDAGLNVKIERFYEWCVEEKPFKDAKGGRPEIDGVHFVNDLTPYIERKLFTVNTSHATAAYFGHHKGYKTVQEAMKDEEINKQVREAIKETAHLIVNKHGITQKDQDEYMDRIIRRISNPHLEDYNDRVGRAPMRKLSRHERFIGPAAELAERGDPVDALLRSVEMALYFQNVEGDEESVELAKVLKELDSKKATTKLTELEESHPLYDRVEKLVAKVQSSS